MTRHQLERHQVWVYLSAISLGLAVGAIVPAVAGSLDVLLWPALGVLLYATFTQVPLTQLADAVRDVRFIGTVLAGNFVLVPLLVAGLLPLVPNDPAIRFGVLLVLLVPCTDWFITFTHLGGGDTHRALTVTPVNLLGQVALLPVMLWLFLGRSFIEILDAERLVSVFVSIILLPLAAAYLTERALERSSSRSWLVAKRALPPSIASRFAPASRRPTHRRSSDRAAYHAMLANVASALVGAGTVSELCQIPPKPGLTPWFTGTLRCTWL
jgi:arsenite transporter